MLWVVNVVLIDRDRMLPVENFKRINTPTKSVCMYESLRED